MAPTEGRVARPERRWGCRRGTPRSIWSLTLEVQRENAPYSSSEPNESDIVNRQSKGEKLKYILKFYIGGTCLVISRMRNDDLALCL